jgi:hypothetical protein
MLPLKWKIFRFVNYLYLLITLVILIYLIYNGLSSELGGANDLFIYILVTLCPLLLAVNCSINSYMIEKCYPDLYAKTLTTTSLGFLILSCIILGLTILLMIFGIADMISGPQGDGSANGEDYKFLLALSVIVIIGVYICWMQVILGKTIRRNFEKSLDNFLKS